MNGQMSGLVLVDFRRIDFDVDDFSVFGELGDLSGDAIVEADAERQKQVGLVNGVVGVYRAVHAEHLQAENMLARKATQTQQRQDHRYSGSFGERRQVSRCARGNSSSAGIDHRPFALADGVQDRFELAARGTTVRTVARKIHRWIVIRYDLPGLNVLRQVDNHRPWSAGPRDVKRFLDD